MSLGVRRSWLAIAVAAALLASPVSADDNCADRRVLTVVFGNGMFTTPEDAAAGLEQLAALVAGPLSDQLAARPEAPHKVEFEIAYNANEEPWEQLTEVASQRAASELADFWRALGGAAPVPEWLSAEWLRLAAGIDEVAFVRDADLMRHVERDRLLIGSGSKVVLVAHSQGNLYANAVHHRLSEASAEEVAALGLVGVATPASTLPSPLVPLPYTTLEEDLVIGAVREVFPSTLAANSSGAGTPLPLLAHGFIDSYLAAEQPRRQVLVDVLRVESALVPVTDPMTNRVDVPAPDFDGTVTECRLVSTGEEVPPAGACDWRSRVGCIDAFFGACWDPMGACSSGADGLAWANGAHVSIEVDVSDPSAPRVRSAVVGSSGETCATGMSSETDDCAGLAVYARGNQNLTLCATEDGAITITCPDGSTTALPPSAMECVFDSAAESCEDSL